MATKATIGAIIGLEGEKDFRNAISSINSDIKVLTSEMKLVTAEFAGNQNSVEALTAKDEILNKKLEAQKEKVETLKTAYQSGIEAQEKAKTSVDDYKESLTKAEQELADMKNSSSATAAEISEQESVVNKLKTSLSDANDSYTKIKSATNEWKISLNNAETEIANLNNDITTNNKYLDEAKSSTKGVASSIDEYGNSVNNAEEGTLSFADILKANLLSDTIIQGVKTLVSGLKDLITTGIDYNAEIEQYQTSFEVMTGSAEEAAEITQKLKDIATATPFELTDLADTTQLLMNYGFTAEDAIDQMEMLGDVSQGNSDKMNSIAMAYGQIYSAGKVTLENINQMIENGFNPLQEISQTTGESMDSLYSRISAGTVSVDEITASMERSTSEGGKYYQSMEKQSLTLDGQLSTLKDTISGKLGDAMSSTSNKLTSEVIPAITNLIDSIDVDAISNAIGNVITGIMDFAQIIIDKKDIILPIVANIGVAFAAWKITSTISALVTAMKGLSTTLGIVKVAQEGVNTVMKANPIGIVITIITVLVTTLMTLWTTNEGFRDFVKSAWATISDTVVSVATGIADFFTQTLPNAFQGAIDWISSIPGKLWDALVSAVANVTQWGLNLQAKAIEAGSNLVSGIVDTVASLPGDMLTIGSNIVTGIWNGISDAKDWILDKIKGFGSDILDGIKDFFGIHSPSTLFRDEVGTYLAQGLGIGFTNEMTNVTSDIANSIPTNFDLNTSIKSTKTASANSASTNTNGYSDLTKLITDIANRPIVLSINGKEFANATVDDISTALSNLTKTTSRSKGVVAV